MRKTKVTDWFGELGGLNSESKQQQQQWFANGFFDELFNAKKMEDLWSCKTNEMQFGIFLFVCGRD
jgi:hypothetical protein